MSNASNPSVSRAMIFAAGLGTRFKPWTDLHPKALALVNGKSLLQRNIEYLQRFGIRDVVVNVHHFAGQIVDALRVNEGWGSAITISDETDVVLETGGGLMKARPLLEGGPFVAMNVDILTDLDLGALIRDHFAHRPLVTLAVTERITSRYFLFDEGLRLRGWRNVQTGQERMAGKIGHDDRETVAAGADADGADVAGSVAARADAAGSDVAGYGSGSLVQKAFSGIHLIEPALFPLVRQTGKFSTVDMYLDLAGERTIRGYDHSGSLLIDVGKPAAAEKAGRLFPH